MKLLLIFIFIFIAIKLSAQSTYRIKRGEIYKTSINNNQPAYFLNITDSSLLVTPNRIQFGSNSANTSEIVYHQIDNFKLWRTGSIGRGILYGSLSGMATGVVIGASSQPNHLFSRGAQAFVGGLIGLVPGAVAGGVIGNIKKRYSPNNEKEKFRRISTYIHI